MSLNDKLKAAVDDLDLDRRLAQLKQQAGDLAAEHGEQVERILDKVESEIDTRTKGKYADRVAQVRRQVSTGVAKVAEQRHRDEPAD